MGRSWVLHLRVSPWKRCSGCLQGWQHNLCALVIFCKRFPEGFGPGARAVCGLGSVSGAGTFHQLSYGTVPVYITVSSVQHSSPSMGTVWAGSMKSKCQCEVPLSCSSDFSLQKQT